MGSIATINFDGKATVETSDEDRLQEVIGFFEGHNALETQFCSQTILEGGKESFHPSFGLGRKSTDWLNSQGL